MSQVSNPWQADLATVLGPIRQGTHLHQDIAAALLAGLNYEPPKFFRFRFSGMNDAAFRPERDIGKDSQFRQLFD
jgi:hypothetical protein